jgi:hypothetical protein
MLIFKITFNQINNTFIVIPNNYTNKHKNLLIKWVECLTLKIK